MLVQGEKYDNILLWKKLKKFKHFCKITNVCQVHASRIESIIKGNMSNAEQKVTGNLGFHKNLRIVRDL